MTTSLSQASTSFAHDSNKLAETYHRLSDLQFESGKELVRHFGELRGARVLDIGCGTGRLARWIAAEVVGPSGSVVGLDPLPERIGIARASAASASGALEFAVGQAEDLRAFAPRSFDAVSYSSVFHWIEDKPRALTEARRLLRPGGHLGMTTMSREVAEAGTMSSVLRSVLEKAPYAGRVTSLPLAPLRQTTTDLVTMVLDSGLELEQLHVMPRRSIRASGEEMVDFLESSSFGNFLRTIPEELRGVLRKDLAEAFEARRGPDGIVLKDWLTVLVATA